MISIDTAKQHLRVDGSDEDGLIQLYVEAATQAACDYLGRKVYADQDALDADPDADPDAGEHAMVITPSIRAAVLLILGDLYANRERHTSSITSVVLDRAQALLRPHRIVQGP